MKAFGKFDFKERIVSPHDRMLFRRSINDLFNNLSSLKDLLDKTLFFIKVFMIFFNFDNSGDHIISFSNLSQGYFIRIFRVFLQSDLAGNFINIHLRNRNHLLIFISNLPHAIVPVVSVAFFVCSKALATLLAGVGHPGNKIFYNNPQLKQAFQINQKYDIKS